MRNKQSEYAEQLLNKREAELNDYRLNQSKIPQQLTNRRNVWTRQDEMKKLRGEIKRLKTGKLDYTEQLLFDHGYYQEDVINE